MKNIIQNWDIALNVIFLACISTMLIAKLVLKLRTSVKKEWMTIVLCIFIYFTCIAASVFLSKFSHSLEQTAGDMRNPCSSSYLHKEWGNELSKENRTKYSQGMAQGIFIREGAFRDYFDLNGQMLEYEPTKIDRQYRVNYQAKIQQIEYYSFCFFWMSILCLLVPLAGVGLGFTSWPKRYLNFTNKPKADK